MSVHKDIKRSRNFAIILIVAGYLILGYAFGRNYTAAPIPDSEPTLLNEMSCQMLGDPQCGNDTHCEMLYDMMLCLQNFECATEMWTAAVDYAGELPIRDY